MKKRILSMLLAIVMVVGLMPGFTLTASAATISGKCGDNATYTLTDDGVLTVSGTGAIEKNAFGSSAENYATLNKGFTDYLTIQKVVINEGITEISNQAFNGCSSITSVALPSTITKIQDNAFFQCTNLKSINLPEGLTYIGTNAFYQCKNLTEITLPSTLTSLGNAAFQSCTSLKTVILSEGMTATIPQYAFWGAILTDITIPASVKKLNQYAFWAASNLKNVTIKNNDISFGDKAFSASDIVFTVPCNFDETKITASVVNNKNFTFSSDYLHIDANNDGTCDAEGCGTATVASVSLNTNSITLTAEGATGMLIATIAPDTVSADFTWRSDNPAVAAVSNGVVTAVGAGTATITVEAGGKTATCSVTVSLPENPVTGVSLSQTSLTLAVNDTYELDAIIEPENADMKSVTWSSDASNVATVDSDGVVKAVSAGSATITVTTQDGGKTATCAVTVLESHEHTWASYTGTCDGCSLTHYTHGAYEWSNGVCSICGVTGGYCGYVGKETDVEYILTSTDTGNTYTLTISGYGIMGEYNSSNPPWYSYRTNITSVIIKNGVNDIGWGSFKYHTALQSVSIPGSVTEIKKDAFLGASSLTSISLPSSVTTIGQSVFKESGLTSITIPSGVNKIQGSTFSGCTKLASVTLPNSITEIEGNAFQRCTALTSINIPDSVTSIGEWAFNQSGLTSVTIPSSVTSLGMHAFSGCPNLKTVTINGTDLTIAERAFQGDEALEILTINNTGNVSIGDYAFMIEVAEDDDDNVDIGGGEIGGWESPDDDGLETQTFNSIGYYSSESASIERKQDKLYSITLPENVGYTTDYATSFKNRVRSISIEETATVVVGNSTTLTPVFTPDTAFDNTITWMSNNDDIATVDSNGKVTGVSAGEATITATSNYKYNGVNRSDLCTVTVTVHTHNWTYGLDGTDTITATCTNPATCSNTNGGSIKITANNSTYAPNTPNAANLTDANGDVAVVIGGLTELPTIQYQKKSGEEWGTATTTAPTDAGTYKASITVDTDKIAEVEYTIAKADAAAPTGLTAVYGQTLANVSLPDGWSWVNSSVSVGDVGAQTHKANYAGSANYEDAENVDVTVTVTQSGAAMTATANKSSYSYGEDITVTVNIAPTAAAPVLFMAEPTANQVAIFNGSNQITEPQTVAGQPMTFTVTGLDVGTYTLTAKYIAGNMEGKTANAQAITITKATPTITAAPTADGITYGQILNDSTLTGGEASVAGSFAWTSTDTVPTVSGGSTGYEVTFTPNDTANYTTATVTVALTVAPKDITGAAVGAFAAMTYNGTAQTPSATVTIGELTVEGSWSDVTNVTDTTTFTASGNFTGKIENQNPGMQKLSLTGATITLEDDSLIYNGSAQSVTITEVKVGNITVPADAYSVSGNTGTDVNSYTLTITAKENTNFTGSATKDFTISKSGSVIANDSIKVYCGETKTTDFTYGDVITVKAQVAPTGEAPVTFMLISPEANQMALFCGATQISEAVNAVDGVYTMTYDTAGKALPVGTSTLTAKYVGNDNMVDTEKNVTITIAAKPLTVGSAAAVGRDYEKNNTSVEITDVTISGKAVETDEVSVDLTDLTGTLASANAGTYTKVTLLALILTGDHKDYYVISGGEVDTDVTLAQITGTTSVDASPVTYSDTSAKTQDLANVVAAFKSGSEELTYAVASKGSEIASASMDDSQLTFNLANGLTGTGTATITVEVSGFTNYSKVTVTVNIELTDKTAVTVDMSDIVLDNRDFNGEALTYTGEAKANGYNGAFTYTWQDAEGNALAEAPSDAGTYRLAASVSDTVFYAGSNYVTVTIAPKEVTVTALDKSAYVSSAAPDLSAPVAGKDYTISGLVDDTTVTVTLSCTPDISKAGEYVITPSASEESGNYTFTYVNGKLTVSYRPVYSDPTYRPTIEDTTGGDTTVSDKNPEKGDKVTITTDPDKGYEVGEITVTDSKGNEVEVIDNGDGTFTYVQPIGKVTITVTYVCNGTHNCPSLAYIDLNTKQWYHEATDYVIEKGLMNGVGDGLFAPDGTTSRAMIVTILWRLEGEPVYGQGKSGTFADVPEDLWYTEAIEWAAANGIVEGWGGKFDPNGDITREQFAAILWRYAKYKGYDVSVGEDTNILSYEDAFSISEWAITAMQWACGSGLMEGDGVKLIPRADATRTQAAALFQRFCENVAKK